ncbi:uncharacterized protein B0P05DRAFT_614862, partial [Gilbertella persicaria]|uniref:uncharacterized protein n=1 Tax=Gilbertella persicaria TaxID=101096 RepID=UPI00221F2BA1
HYSCYLTLPFQIPSKSAGQRKKCIRKNPLNKGSEMTLHITKACNTVTTKDCLQWAKHAESYWERCIQK